MVVAEVGTCRDLVDGGMSSAQVGGAARVGEELCVAGEAVGRSSVEEEAAAETRSVQELEATGMSLVLEEEEAGVSLTKGLGGGGNEVALNIRACIRTLLESIILSVWTLMEPR
jgi:hypothetical protein